MKSFFYGVGTVAAYFVLIIVGMAAIIGLGYLLGWGISVWQPDPTATSGVCTSTLCQ